MYINLEGLPGVLYSRKSRKDIEAEREAAAAGRPYDTLEKHREELFRMSRQYKVHVVDLLEEIVSGEYIAERPKMQRVLEMLADGEIRWVGVMDEDRLGRGDKIDQGRIERAFKESGAYILTPGKIVDLQDEADELYMDYKGMGARYEYKQTKKRLHGGRKRSAARGNYVGAKANYGYIKGIDFKTRYPHLIKEYVDNPVDMLNLRLYPHPEEAKYVKKIFEWFLNGVTVADIIVRLNGLTPSPTGLTDWRYNTVHRILKNPVYCGTIRYGNRQHTKLETGKYRTKLSPREKVQEAEDAHIPLVSWEDYDKVQEIINENYNPPINRGKKIVNPTATLLKCHYCGLAMSFRIYYTDPRSNREPIILCKNPLCNSNHAVVFRHVEEELLRQIQNYYKSIQSDPTYRGKSGFSEDLIANFQRQKLSVDKQMKETRSQLDNTHDLLEKKVYTVEVFLERQKTLTEKLGKLQEELDALEESIQKEKDTASKRTNMIPKIHHVLNVYESASTEEKNKLLKSIIEFIYYDKPHKGGSRKKPVFNLRVVWKTV
ncbi:recombinase family protein [Paenibacillus glucanolyticus]|uniref:recombinase family protein n=1 Tax=Paenibacillus glucanolyticus TaxID=59843 RepID=UPI0035DA5E8A